MRVKELASLFLASLAKRKIRFPSPSSSQRDRTSPADFWGSWWGILALPSTSPPPDRELCTFFSCSTFFTRAYPFLGSDQYVLQHQKKSLLFPICDWIAPWLFAVSVLSWWTALKFQSWSVNMPSDTPLHTHTLTFLLPALWLCLLLSFSPPKGAEARMETQTFCSLLKKSASSLPHIWLLNSSPCGLGGFVTNNVFRHVYPCLSL